MNNKILVWSYLIILSFATIINLYIPKNEAVAKDSVVIPADAIRLRILANSDSAPDQEIKRMVRDAVNAQITLWVQDLTSKDKARMVLKSKLPELQAIAEEVVRQQGSDQAVNVEFGEKVKFPTKLYGEFLYPAGEYQAILITLGEGTGANWWCVLYPPLCFLDFSNGVAVGNGFEEQEVEAAMTDKTEELVETEAPVVEEVEADIEEQEETVKVTKKATVTKKAAVTKEITATKKSSVTKKETAAVTSKKLGKPLEVGGASETSSKEAEEQEVKTVKKEQAAPVYTAEDEEPVKVKFFVVEMWEKIF
jgi:stage II sporulation protein R